MNENIVSISKVENSANPTLVEHLERLLGEAKNGELVGFAAAAQYTGSSWSTSWVLNHRDVSVIHLIGILQCLISDLAYNKNIEL